jgi:hypothetical protein
MRDGVGVSLGGASLTGHGSAEAFATGMGLASGGGSLIGGASSVIERGWVAVTSAWTASVGASAVDGTGLAFEPVELLAVGPTPLLVYLRSSVTIQPIEIFQVEVQPIEIFQVEVQPIEIFQVEIETIGDAMPYAGQTLTRRIIVRDEISGDLFNPTELRVSLVLPDGSTDTLLFGGPQSTDACLVQESLGTFLLAYPVEGDGDVNINIVIRHPYHGREIVRKLPLAHHVTIEPDPVGYTDQPAPETP